MKAEIKACIFLSRNMKDMARKIKKKRILSMDFKRSTACWYLSFRYLTLKKWDNFCCLKPPSLWHFLREHWKAYPAVTYFSEINFSSHYWDIIEIWSKNHHAPFIISITSVSGQSNDKHPILVLHWLYEIKLKFAGWEGINHREIKGKDNKLEREMSEKKILGWKRNR